MVHKHIIAGMTALAIGFAGLTAAPAQASDAGKFFAGVAAGAIIGTAIAKHNDRKNRGYVSSGHHGHKKSYYGHSGHKKKYYGHSGYKRKKYSKRHHRGYKYGHRSSKYHY